VTTTVDENDATSGDPAGPDGTLSLREAINAVNADTGSAADTIDFSQLPGGIQTFSTQLPNFPGITHAVTIDGYLNRPDASKNTATTGDNAMITVQLTFPLGLSGAGASGSTITGLALQELDVFNGSNDTITGNFIGVMPNGQPFSPSGLGLILNGTSFTTIGGNTPARNVISGSNATDVTLQSSSNNQVVGNLIGTDLSGIRPVMDDHSSAGVSILGTATTGGNNQVASNVIAFHEFNAVGVLGSTSNVIRANSIFSNETNGLAGAPPIELRSGANDNLAAPTLSSATPSEVDLGGPVSAGTTIDFYANDAADAAGFYEGKTWLGTFSVSVTGSVNQLNLPVGSFITATITDAQNNTSQFSNGILVEPSSGTTPPDDGVALAQLTSLVDLQVKLLNTLNSKKKKPSPTVAQNVLQIERGLSAAFVNLVQTSFTPGDATFKALGLRFLDLDTEIEERAAAILTQADKAKESAAGSAHARAQLRKKIAAVGAQLTSDLTQDRALTGKLETA
jgi:hypothetical protein